MMDGEKPIDCTDRVEMIFAVAEPGTILLMMVRAVAILLEEPKTID
ncbi:hypothetical protein [Leptolyngbya sp. FACHB-711]|nr:hypothetical protein [Leptolyngbya sp. FACHB-711]